MVLDLAIVNNLLQLQVLGIVDGCDRLLVDNAKLVFSSIPTNVKSEMITCLDVGEGARSRELIDVQAHFWESVQINLPNCLTTSRLSSVQFGFSC